MTQSVSLSDSTFSKLQQLAKPFVDTPETVIAALADAEIARRDGNSAVQRGAPDALDPDRHDSLTHSRLISAAVNGEELHRPKWNSLLDRIHELGRKQLGSFEALRKATNARLRDGRYEDDGYHYLPGVGLSLQGVDANAAWDHALGLARQLRVPIEVRFEWRARDDAARPGQQATLSWKPTKLSVA